MTATRALSPKACDFDGSKNVGCRRSLFRWRQARRIWCIPLLCLFWHQWSSSSSRSCGPTSSSRRGRWSSARAAPTQSRTRTAFAVTAVKLSSSAEIAGTLPFLAYPFGSGTPIKVQHVVIVDHSNKGRAELTIVPRELT
jgi:hypothetical protein